MEDNLQHTFIAEAEELFADLEKGLLALEADADNKECISHVFRVMHTLKVRRACSDTTPSTR